MMSCMFVEKPCVQRMTGDLKMKDLIFALDFLAHIHPPEQLLSTE